MSKIIDWQLSLKLANNRADLAKELLEILTADLPVTREQINDAYAKQDFTLLARHIHKLYGATCYCGVPRLKDVVAQVDENLKKQQPKKLPSLIKKLNTEIDKIITHFNLSDFEQAYEN